MKAIEQLIIRREGILKLRPEYVHRFYPDLNRLGQRGLKRRSGQFIPERWIGSSVRAVNPPGIPTGGLSMLADTPGVSLREAIRQAPQALLGPEVAAAHGPEFRVLVKILDPSEPIVFHFHATDRQVRTMPQHFRGHRFGKDEAYYFLDAPKGSAPYTHAGLHAGVTKSDLIQAIRRGPEHALELSPSFYQAQETGFFLPAGVPHRPGTALTLEMQQPSDVYTLLEGRAGGKPLSARQMHPGFGSLDEALELIDLKRSRAVGALDAYRLTPRIERTSSGGEIATVFPSNVCRKFAGQRIRASRSIIYRRNTPLVLWMWKGRARLNGRPARRGDEFFISCDAGRDGIELQNSGPEPVEAFTFYPVVEAGAGRSAVH